MGANEKIRINQEEIYQVKQEACMRELRAVQPHWIRSTYYQSDVRVGG